jgi:hypothetical protein
MEQTVKKRNLKTRWKESKYKVHIVITITLLYFYLPFLDEVIFNGYLFTSFNPLFIPAIFIYEGAHLYATGSMWPYILPLFGAALTLGCVYLWRKILNY